MTAGTSASASLRATRRCVPIIQIRLTLEPAQRLKRPWTQRHSPVCFGRSKLANRATAIRIMRPPFHIGLVAAQWQLRPNAAANIHRAARDPGAPPFTDPLSTERMVKPSYACWTALGLAAIASEALAQMPPTPVMQAPPVTGYGYPEPPGSRDPREGKVQVQTFLAQTPRAVELGHGPIAITAGPTTAALGGSAILAPDLNSGDGLIEAALADQLGRTGYQPGVAGTGQTLEYVITREILQPPEPPHSPVQGSVAVGGGTGGFGYHGRGYGGADVGVGIMVDLSKPLGALIDTRIEARISDAATRELLWQGYAEVVARENDKRWRPETIASRLTAALFKTFPRPKAG